MGRAGADDILRGPSANLIEGPSMVGARTPLRQGRRSARGAFGLLLLLLSSPALADRRDQRAADLYTEGVRLIRQGRYREGAAKVNAALARGATEPVEAQGSETRFLARPYDPYYWLGVAQMETGLPEQALANFEKSATIVPKGRSRPVLADAPAEWADLERRRAALLARLDVPSPVAVAAAATPTPEPTPLALRLPTRVPEPTAPPALAVAAIPSPTSRPTPEVAPLPATALELRDDLAALLAEPVVAVRAGDLLRSRLGMLEAALARGPAVAAAAERRLRSELAGKPGELLLLASLQAGLEAHRDRRYEESARLARVAGRLAPARPQPHLLRAVSLGTKWVLDGERNAKLEDEAREAYAAWRARRRADAPPSRFLSPSLGARLEGSAAARSPAPGEG